MSGALTVPPVLEPQGIAIGESRRTEGKSPAAGVIRRLAPQWKRRLALPRTDDAIFKGEPMATEGSGPVIGPAVVRVGAAVIAVPLLRRLGLGWVLGYFAAGTLVGPSVFDLFIIGLELRPQKLWALRGQIFGLVWRR